MTPVFLERLRADAAGASLLETAIALSALLMLMFGVLDCSRALYADVYVGYAAQAAARYAMVRGSSWAGRSCSATVTASCVASSTDVSNYVATISPIGINSATAVTTTWPGTTPSGAACLATNGNNSPGCVVVVQLTYNFRFVLPFLPSNALPLKSSAAVSIAQ